MLMDFNLWHLVEVKSGKTVKIILENNLKQEEKDQNFHLQSETYTNNFNKVKIK